VADIPLKIPTVDEFKTLLTTEPIPYIVKEYVFGGETYAFKDNPSIVDDLKAFLSGKLDVKEENITIVGSAKIGFSLSPDTFSRKFHEESDIDIIVVDENIFNSIWFAILRWNYPRRYKLPHVERRWANKRANDVFWGWFEPGKIKFKGLSFPSALKPLLDISTLWFSTFKMVSSLDGFLGRDVNGRLYRTWDHAYEYHVDSLAKTREVLINSN